MVGKGVLKNFCSKHLTQVAATLAASTLAMIVGANVALSSSIIPILLKDGELVQDFTEASWIATSFAMVAVPMAIVGGICSDKFGRRRMAMISLIPLSSGLILMGTANSYSVLLLGRCLSSVGAWLGYPCSGVLVSEIVHPSLRGTLGVFPSIFISTGLFISFSLGYLIDSWRQICFILLFIPTLSFCCLLCIKESPYWLVQHNKKEEAEENLQWYRETGADISAELNDIIKKKEESLEVSAKTSILSTIFSMQFFRAQMCSGFMQFFHQFTGISALNVYMINIFQDANLSFDPRLAPVLVGATRIILGIFSSVALKKGNRKYIFSGCAFTLSVCAMGIASITLYREMSEGSPYWLGFLPFPLILLMFMSHSFGCVTVMNLLAGEVFPTAIRSLGQGVVTCLGMGGNAIQSAIYPYVLEMVGVEGCFFWFSIQALFLTIYGFCIIPDNRGLSLTNIERGMEKKKNKSDIKV